MTTRQIETDLSTADKLLLLDLHQARLIGFFADAISAWRTVSNLDLIATMLGRALGDKTIKPREFIQAYPELSMLYDVPMPDALSDGWGDEHWEDMQEVEDAGGS